MKSDKVLMHAIDKLVPNARAGLDVAVGTPEEFYQAIERAKRDERALLTRMP